MDLSWIDDAGRRLTRRNGPITEEAPRQDVPVNLSRRRGRDLARLVRLPADDEGLDVVPAIAVGSVRDALLELSEELGQETGSTRLALAEGTEEERAAQAVTLWT